MDGHGTMAGDGKQRLRFGESLVMVVYVINSVTSNDRDPGPQLASALQPVFACLCHRIRALSRPFSTHLHRGPQWAQLDCALSMNKRL